ncbi:nuclear transport factor 2 family protein [bacterium]|nr:nuclear transport factor 2 family protein [bacterium]
MRKIIFTLLLLSLITPLTSVEANATIISDRAYRAELRKEQKQDIKQIKQLFKTHNEYANKHNSAGLKPLYADNYINNDGFDKATYFKSIDETWAACEDLTYSTKILSININGENASVNVEESASGTITETIESVPVAGEIHSKAVGIYHLIKINGNWYISGETAITDESSLLYGDARFMNIEINSPAQVSAGEDYTIGVKVDADEDTFIIGSIDHDPVKYPPKTPKSELRALGQSQTLERIIKANTDNLNEYAVASLAISKVRTLGEEHYRIYMAGLACVMKRVNVVPKNNFIEIEE